MAKRQKKKSAPSSHSSHSHSRRPSSQPAELADVEVTESSSSPSPGSAMLSTGGKPSEDHHNPDDASTSTSDARRRKKKSASRYQHGHPGTSYQNPESVDAVASASSPQSSDSVTDRSPVTGVKPAQDHQPDKASKATDGAQLRGPTQPSSRLLAEAGAKFKALKGRKEAQAHPRLASTSSLATGAVLAQSKSAPKHDRAASPDSGRSSAAPAPPAIIINQPSEGVEAAPAIACAACIVISAFISFIVIKEALQSSMRYRSSFCCPSDVEALAQYVNGSSDPCDSFYNFICAGVVARRSDESMPMAMYFSPGPPRLNARFELDVLMARNGTRSEVSTFLRSLFDSCLNADADEKTTLMELEAALIRIAGDQLRSMTPANAFAYLLLTNVKYGMPSAILIAFQAVSAILVSHNPREGCHLSNKLFQMCLNFSVVELNKILGWETNISDVNAYIGSLENTSDKDVSMERFSGKTASELLERWQVEPALKVVSIGFGNITRVDVRGLPQIDSLFGMLSVAHTSSRQAAASYFLASSACNALIDLKWRISPSMPTRKAFCMRLMDLMPNVRNTMYMVEFITPEKNNQVTRVVNSVIETVKSDCISSSVFRPEDSALLRTFFDSITLVLPQAISPSGIKETHFTESFLEKVLRGQASEHETRLELASRGLPFESAGAASRDYNYIQLLSGDNIIVSPALYSLVRIDPAHTDVFNTPVIALALAESIWSFILTEARLWSPAARANIGALIQCFRHNYLMTSKEGRDIEDEIDTVAASLALSSVLKSFEEPNWYRVETAWRYWSLSHSRFFYMREAFYRCPLSFSITSKDNVDVPLMYADDFSRVFQCQFGDRMKNRKACRFV
ncbi:hypothetical protein MRX96_039744 [Rhipicephalus microplus]|uniref:Peptidase M13 N-terminal domain-containing protein n=1 Tax=Rhipicephalus microplus TaxID=6941 RepID=A0A9J6DVA1_RHIMP|nr:hypothetical protein HPB51_016149 [Rhipicephalus microplus]